MTTKRQIIKALDAAGFTGVEIHYHRDHRHWQFFGGEANRWWTESTAHGYSGVGHVMTLADSVEAWVGEAKYLRSENVEHLETDEDEGEDTLTIIWIEDNSSTFTP